jgi:hypothetical protein
MFIYCTGLLYRMSKKASSFGEPKALPLQPSFKATEADVLEREAKEMEARLKSLQTRMAMQQQEDESIQRVAGARWKVSIFPIASGAYTSLDP